MRRSITGLAALLLTSSVLAGCATTPEHVPLSAQARAGLSSTEVVLPVPQSEIYIDVPASQVSRATGGGLLPALIDAGIDSARASKASKDVTPLRNAAADFSFDQAFSDAFKAVAASDGVHVDGVRVVKDLTTLDQAITGSKSGSVLVAGANYHLANDGGSLWIEVRAALYHAGAAPAGASDAHASAVANALYRNTFWFTINLPHPSAKRDENLGALPLEGKDTEGWVAGAIRASVAGPGLSFVEAPAAGGQGVTLNVSLLKAYVLNMNMAKTATVLLKVRYRRGDADLGEVLYRGNSAGVHWGVGKGEFADALNAALRDALAPLSQDVSARCRAGAPTAG